MEPRLNDLCGSPEADKCCTRHVKLSFVFLYYGVCHRDNTLYVSLISADCGIYTSAHVTSHQWRQHFCLFTDVQAHSKRHLTLLYNLTVLWTFITSAKEDMFSSLFVCLLATVSKNFPTDLPEIFRDGWQWANEQTIKFWWRSKSRIRIRTATQVRRALAEVCTVPVLLVRKCVSNLQENTTKLTPDFHPHVT